MKKSISLLLFTLTFTACTPAKSAAPSASAGFYAATTTERPVSFSAVFRTAYKTHDDLLAHRADIKTDIAKVLRFLHGPLQHRFQGSPQGEATFDVRVEEAERVGETYQVPFTYTGIWLLKLGQGPHLRLPLPYDLSLKDKDGAGFCQGVEIADNWFWYRWDTTWYGCREIEGEDFQMLDIALGPETARTRESFPPYKQLIHLSNGRRTLRLTFAFGYLNAQEKYDPFADEDPGAYNMSNFGHALNPILRAYGFSAYPIRRSDYGGDDSEIGTRYEGKRNGVDIVISVLATGNQQMEPMRIFARSFAIDHDGFFGWFGHSHVGDNYDAKNLREILESDPEKYQVTQDFQLVYFAGCSGYHNYTAPFFKLKSGLDPGNDPTGAKRLHILSNGLDNDGNLLTHDALALFNALFYWEDHTSYQKIVDHIERLGAHDLWSTFLQDVLLNIQGDQDQTVIGQ